MPESTSIRVFPKVGRPAQGALEVAGYLTLEDLTKISEAEMLKLHGVGPKAVRVLKEEMATRGLAFASATVKK